MAMAVNSTALAKWERAKRLTYVLDSTVDAKRIAAGRLGDPEKRGVRQWKLADVPSEMSELRQLVIDLGLVASTSDWLTLEPSSLREGRTLDAVATRVALTKIIRGDQFIDGLLTARVLDKSVQGWCVTRTLWSSTEMAGHSTLMWMRTERFPLAWSSRA